MSESVNDTKYSLCETANLQTTSKTYLRGTNRVITYQGAEGTTPGGDATALTAAAIATGIITTTADADRSKATPTAAQLCSTLGLEDQNDSVEFSLLNLATDGASHILLTAGTSVTLVGNMQIMAEDAADQAISTGVGQFRIRRTDAATGTPTVTIYRIA